jgi:hypothetical protein
LNGTNPTSGSLQWVITSAYSAVSITFQNWTVSHYKINASQQQINHKHIDTVRVMKLITGAVKNRNDKAKNPFNPILS